MIFDAFFMFYFITCTAIFIAIIRNKIKNSGSLSLKYACQALFLSYVPGINWLPAANALKFIFDALAKKAENITLWKKKDDRP